jgi:OmpA-OmpF porin, OOP family
MWKGFRRPERSGSSHHHLAVTLVAAGALSGIIALSTDAHAQLSRNVDLPRFEPSPAGDRFFGVPSPYTPGNVILHGGVLLDYARNPLIITDSDGNTAGHVVEHQMLLHLDLNLSLAERIAINLDLPLALVNRGDGTFEAGTFTGPNAFVSPGGGGIGDLRLGARLRLFGGYHDPLQIALGGYLWLPTAKRDDFLTDAKVRGQVHAIAGGRVDRFIWTAMVGPTFRSSQSYGGVQLGSQLDWGAGAGVLLGASRDVQLGIESVGAVTLVSSTRSTNSEALVGIKVRVVDPIELGLGVGRGFARGLGTPDLRAIFSLFYTPKIEEAVAYHETDSDFDGVLDRVDACPQLHGLPSNDPQKNGCPPPIDSDGDGITNDLDACPNEAGKPSNDAKKNGCPPVDADHDGITDEVDACPMKAGPASEDPKKNGCPLPSDRDGDGVADGDDACPTLAGVKTNDPATNGCPGDADADGFRDDQDACPHEKGVDDPDPAKKGCPKLVRVTSSEIVILEQVQFDTDKATIQSTSDALLGSVAQVMQEHPEILAVEVQGHTDNRGKKTHNTKLSQERANAVMLNLVGRGIAEKRLSAKGYGQDVPLSPNDSDEGRQKNRRVQFVLKARAPAPDASPAHTEK